jgi:hypothetical protein
MTPDRLKRARELAELEARIGTPGTGALWIECLDEVERLQTLTPSELVQGLLDARDKQGDQLGAVIKLKEEIERLQAEAEQLRVQLAGCGVAAMCNTPTSMEEQRCKEGGYGWSVSYGDVLRAVETQMKYRAALEKIEVHGWDGKKSTRDRLIEITEIAKTALEGK